jgi:sialic acid synthase SpsE
MAKIILDFGSGNTNKNNWDYTKRMIDELKAVDTGKHEVIIKWQLFKEAGNNIPLDRDLFVDAYHYAWSRSLPTTSSVFDKQSLDFLLQFDIPFVKIANNRKLDWLAGKIPREIPIYMSAGNLEELCDCAMMLKEITDVSMMCVSKYPAAIEDYDNVFQIDTVKINPNYSFSDHTTNFDLWYKYKPRIIEWHYVLEHDPTNLDGGLFARTPAMLAEVL